jgi:hypothetical protein
VRKKTTSQVETDVLVSSRRRCALCWGLSQDLNVKQGQIAHLDQDPSNSVADNLAFLCFNHHDDYDARRSQSKGFTISEVKCYRDQLYRIFQSTLNELQISTADLLSAEALAVAGYFCVNSETGRKLDPQVRIPDVAVLGLEPEAVAEAMDELTDVAHISMLSQSPPTWVPENRLFWSLDPQFMDHDPVCDAETIATYIVQRGEEVPSQDLAEYFRWDPRRLNPVISFLVENGLAHGRSCPGGPFTIVAIRPTVKTRRFVKERTKRANQEERGHPL